VLRVGRIQVRGIGASIAQELTARPAKAIKSALHRGAALMNSAAS
jgi:hypothetical protein